MPNLAFTPVFIDLYYLAGESEEAAEITSIFWDGRGKKILLLTEIGKQSPVNLYHQDNSPEDPGSSGPVMLLFITLDI